MDTADIQKRLDMMPAAMAAKGLINPSAEFELNANAGARVWLKWRRPDSDRDYDMAYHAIEGETTEAKLEAADAFIAGLPSKDETRLRNFMGALGKVIDMGRHTGIEIEFLNPLTESMKKLSENALTYQKVAAE